MEFQGYCGFHWTTLLLMFMFIFIFKGVNSGDINDQISNHSFHHFGPNVEITDQSIVVPSFSTRILSLSSPGYELCCPPSQTQHQLPTNTAVAWRGQDSMHDG